MEAHGDELMAELRKNFPIESFVETWGGLRFEHWIRRLASHPQAHSQFGELVQEFQEGDGVRLENDLLTRMMGCIRRHDVLEKIVEREWFLELMHQMRPVLFGGENLQAPKKKSKEWGKLYDRLGKILRRYGTDEPAGEGDFYLVDFEAEEPGHKIELSNPDILTPALVTEIQKALQGWKNYWYVIVQLDVDELGLDVEPGGIIIFKDHVDDMWKPERMRELLGPRFHL